MGLFSRIKNWFKRNPNSPKVKKHTPSTPSEAPRRIARPTDAVGSLVWEHKQLDSERSSLKDEMASVDSRFAHGELEAYDRDRAYRLCLARAGRISLRQMEIRQQLVQLGYDVPSDWGIVRRI